MSGPPNDGASCRRWRCLTPKASAKACIQRVKAAAKARGLSRSKVRSKVSWQGMPLAKRRKRCSQARRCRPKVAICCQSLAPQMTVQMAMTMMSMSRWRGRGVGR